MNRTLTTRLDKLETKRPETTAYIVEVRWDEPRAWAIKAAFPDGVPGDLPVYTRTASIDPETWLQACQANMADKSRHDTYGGRGELFPNMFTAQRIGVQDRPWRG